MTEKRKKIPKLTTEDEARFWAHRRLFEKRMAEREAIDRAAAEAAKKSA